MFLNLFKISESFWKHISYQMQDLIFWGKSDFLTLLVNQHFFEDVFIILFTQDLVRRNAKRRDIFFIVFSFSSWINHIVIYIKSLI